MCEKRWIKSLPETSKSFFSLENMAILKKEKLDRMDIRYTICGYIDREKFVVNLGC